VGDFAGCFDGCRGANSRPVAGIRSAKWWHRNFDRFNQDALTILMRGGMTTPKLKFPLPAEFDPLALSGLIEIKLRPSGKLFDRSKRAGHFLRGLA
jgi:hypothetical protein